MVLYTMIRKICEIKRIKSYHSKNEKGKEEKEFYFYMAY